MIVTADDFGLSPTINRAVLEAFGRGLVTHASVMANAEGFDEACARVRDAGVEAQVGAHLVLSSGEPLTQSMRSCQRFCDDEGRFRAHRARGRVLRLESAERRAVRAELVAQVDACRARGLPISHLDSHEHVHTEPGIAPAVIAVARELGVPRVRLARNARGTPPPSTRLYRSAFNRRLRRAGLAGTRYFGDIDDYHALREVGATAAALADFELMTHPDLDANDDIVDFHCARSGAPLEVLLTGVVAGVSA